MSLSVKSFDLMFFEHLKESQGMAEIDYATASELFEDQVTTKFQNKQKLAGTIEERHGVRGEALNVPVSDLIEMQKESFAPTDISITPVNPTNVMIVPENFGLKTVIGGGERTLFAYDMVTSHAKMHYLAAARSADAIKLNALFLYPDIGDIYVVPKEVGPTTGLNADKMTAALAVLEGNSVDITDFNISMWVPAAAKGELLSDDKVVSNFYNDQRPLANGSFYRPTVSYLGVDIRTLGNQGINQIPKTTAGEIDTYLIPMVARDAMVQTYNRDPQTRIEWVGHQDRYVLLSVMTSGANVIQSNGIVFLEVDVPASANA